MEMQNIILPQYVLLVWSSFNPNSINMTQIFHVCYSVLYEIIGIYFLFIGKCETFLKSTSDLNIWTDTSRGMLNVFGIQQISSRTKDIALGIQEVE